jgi:hypothetical protein
MFIFITTALLLLTASVLLVLRFTLGEFRYAWLIAASGALFAWLSVFLWQFGMPVQVQLPAWQPAGLFPQAPFFVADGIAWALALSMVTLCLAVIITAVVRDNFPYPLSWIGVLFLTAFGVLAVTADNPLTLVLLWAAIDIVDLVAQLRTVEKPQFSERVVISYAWRMSGILMLLWADMVSLSNGIVLDFRTAPQQVGLFFVVAAALRLGVLPLHLPYAGESAIRRGFGTGLRLISAGSSLVLLARIPAGSLESPAAPYLILLISFTALYGGWMWLRAPDELTGRPYWLIGMGSLALAAALRANPLGAAAWTIAMLLAGGALFLASAQVRWLERALLVGLWAICALPFSLTATGWQSDGNRFWYFLPLLLAAHAMLMAGLYRHIQRSSMRKAFDNQTNWARNVYPIGILLLLVVLLGLTVFGWDGALRLGNWTAGLAAALLSLGLLWLTPRLRILNPVRAHWVQPSNPGWLESIYQFAWSLYRQLTRLGQSLSGLLEGESGIMWTLLFLALFISLFSQGVP